MRALVLFIAIGAASCAYPRRSTPLSEVADASNLDAPANLWRLRFTGAVVPPRQRGDRPWDEDGTPPDTFVRLYRGDRKVYESPVAYDSLTPRWDDAVTDNLMLSPTQELRIELWDDDGLGLPEPIGVWRSRGLPRTALPGADARVRLEGSAEVGFVVMPPKAYRGTGITEYEVRPDALRVLEVIPRSPAGRAGIEAGTKILEIDGQTVAELGSDAAVGKLSMAGSRQSTLTVLHADGRRDEVRLDAGYVWMAR